MITSTNTNANATANAWDTIAASSIEGSLLLCRKGVWSVDDQPVEADAEIVVLMDSTIVGEILFDAAGKKVTEKVGQIEDGYTMPSGLKPGWAPSLQFTCVGYSEEWRGRILTFRSTAWGAWYAFKRLIKPYGRHKQAQYPVVALGVRDETRSGNDVIDPLLTITDWVLRSRFDNVDDTTPPRLEKPKADDGKVIAFNPPGESGETTVIETARHDNDPDDDIPF
jgi:hypothetical protein